MNTIHEEQKQSKDWEFHPQEYKVVSLRDLPPLREVPELTNVAKAVAYWRENIESAPSFRSDQEQAAVLLLDAHFRIIGHVLIGLGSNSTVQTDQRQIWKAAVIANADCIILMHNHPTGPSEPSAADIRIARLTAKNGGLLGIEFLDSIVIGRGEHTSILAIPGEKGATTMKLRVKSPKGSKRSPLFNPANSMAGPFQSMGTTWGG